MNGVDEQNGQIGKQAKRANAQKQRKMKGCAASSANLLCSECALFLQEFLGLLALHSCRFDRLLFLLLPLHLTSLSALAGCLAQSYQLSLPLGLLLCLLLLLQLLLLLSQSVCRAVCGRLLRFGLLQLNLKFLYNMHIADVSVHQIIVHTHALSAHRTSE